MKKYTYRINVQILYLFQYGDGAENFSEKELRKIDKFENSLPLGGHWSFSSEHPALGVCEVLNNLATIIVAEWIVP